MRECCEDICCKTSKKGIDPKFQFVIGLSAGLTCGLIVWLWSRNKRQQANNLQSSQPHILLETTLPEVAQPTEDRVVEFNLSKLSPSYINAVIQNLEDCQQAWKEPVAVKFVTIGKGIRPSYQIETASGNQFQTFSGNNHVQRSLNQKFNSKNLTARHYTKDNLKAAIK